MTQSKDEAVRLAARAVRAAREAHAANYDTGGWERPRDVKRTLAAYRAARKHLARVEADTVDGVLLKIKEIAGDVRYGEGPHFRDIFRSVRRDLVRISGGEA